MNLVEEAIDRNNWIGRTYCLNSPALVINSTRFSMIPPRAREPRPINHIVIRVRVRFLNCLFIEVARIPNLTVESEFGSIHGYKSITRR